MPVPAPTSRNYSPYTDEGTRIRSEDKEEERVLLAEAFNQVELGNLHNEAIETRVIKDKNVTLPKLADEVVDLIQNSQGVAVVQRQDFVAVQDQVIFDFDFQYTMGGKDLLWFRQGELQRLGVPGVGDYVETLPSQVLIHYPAVTGERFTALKLGIVGGTPAAYETHIAIVGQTLINLGFSYNVGSYELLVFRNGVKDIPNIHYLETSTSSITYLIPLKKGDLVQTIVYQAASSANIDSVGRRVGNEALLASIMNWFRASPTYTDLFFDLFDKPGKQHVSGTAQYFSTEECGGNGFTYVGKTTMDQTCNKVKVLWEDNNQGTLGIQVSSDDGLSLTPILLKDHEYVLQGTRSNLLHVEITFAGDARLRYMAVIMSP
jgi:hypothetical protein